MSHPFTVTHWNDLYFGKEHECFTDHPAVTDADKWQSTYEYRWLANYVCQEDGRTWQHPKNGWSLKVALPNGDHEFVGSYKTLRGVRIAADYRQRTSGSIVRSYWSVTSVHLLNDWRQSTATTLQPDGFQVHTNIGLLGNYATRRAANDAIKRLARHDRENRYTYGCVVACYDNGTRIKLEHGKPAPAIPNEYPGLHAVRNDVQA